MEESWCGGLRSFQRAVERGLITESTSAEIMTHPNLVDGALIDTSNRDSIPMQKVIDTMKGFSESAGRTGE